MPLGCRHRRRTANGSCDPVSDADERPPVLRDFEGGTTTTTTIVEAASAARCGAEADCDHTAITRKRSNAGDRRYVSVDASEQ